MLKSMTGFGGGEAALGAEEISVEVRSWNHKFCEVKVRLPRELSALEPNVSRLVKDRLARGSIEVLIKRAGTSFSPAVPVANLELAKRYQAAISSIARELNLSPDFSVLDLAGQPGVIRLEEREVDVESTWPALEAALKSALEKLTQMRRTEGETLQAELQGRLGRVQAIASEVRALAPRAVEEYRQRLLDRISELSRGIAVEPQRIAQEVAFFAERSDIEEEIARLSSHLQQFRALFDSPEPAGRRMEFLVQEMNREINTTGAKSQHSEIASRVVAIKAELERIREQVQNVE
jgi:uncharacterized protein (TIGR00255 family)